MGIHFSKEQCYEELCTQSSPLGGFHIIFSEDFNVQKDVPQEFQNEIVETGQTTSTFEVKFSNRTLSLVSLRNAYFKGSEQLWA